MKQTYANIAKTHGNRSVSIIAHPMTDEQRKQGLTEIWWECRCDASFANFKRGEKVHARNTGDGVIVRTPESGKFIRMSEAYAYDLLIVVKRLPPSGKGSARWYAEQTLRRLFRNSKTKTMTEAQFLKMVRDSWDKDSKND